MAQDTPSRKLDQYIVRFPDGMRDRLKSAAERNKRSMNAEIVSRLERTFGQGARQHLHDVFEEARKGNGEPVLIGDAPSADDFERGGTMGRIVMPADMTDDEFADMMRAATEEAVQKAIQRVLDRGGRVERLGKDDK